MGAWAELEKIDRAFSIIPKVTRKVASRERSGEWADSVRDGMTRPLHTFSLGLGNQTECHLRTFGIYPKVGTVVPMFLLTIPSLGLWPYPLKGLGPLRRPLRGISREVIYSYDTA